MDLDNNCLRNGDIKDNEVNSSPPPPHNTRKLSGILREQSRYDTEQYIIESNGNFQEKSESRPLRHKRISFSDDQEAYFETALIQKLHQELQDKAAVACAGSIIESEEEDPEIQNTSKHKRKTWFKRYVGIILGIGACVSFSLCILIVKLLADKFHAFSLGVYRFLGVNLNLPILLYYRYGLGQKVFDPISPITGEKCKIIGLLCCRAVFGCTAIVLQFLSVKYMSIADSTVIAFSTPIFVGIFARIFLGEKCGIVPVLTALITFMGVVITSKLPVSETFTFNHDNLIGSSLAFVSMLFATSIFIILRKLRCLHFTLITSSFGLIGLFECVVLCSITSRFDIPTNPKEWFYISSIAILTFIGQNCMTGALKFEDAGPISLVRTCDVVFSFIWQSIFLNLKPDIYSTVGAIIVCFGVSLTTFRKYVINLPDDNPAKEKWWFMLK